MGLLSNPRTPRRLTTKLAAPRNVELALRRAISAMAGKNVSDNEKQHAIRDCEIALQCIINPTQGSER